MNKDEYLTLRNSMLHKEYQMRTGGTMKLSDDELRVNATLMKFKANELEAARNNVTNFPPAVHFFRAKALIDKSDVFRIIRNMPKGTLVAFVKMWASWNTGVTVGKMWDTIAGLKMQLTE